MSAHQRDLPTFLGETKPVDLITHLESYQLDDQGISLRCGCQHHQLTRQEYYGTVCEVMFDPPTPVDPVRVRIDFCTAEIFRIRYGMDESNPEYQTPMVVGEFTQPVPFTSKEVDDEIHLETKSIRLVVNREPWQLLVYDLQGKKIWETRPVDIAPLRRPEMQWNPPQQRWLFLHRYAYPWGISPGDIAVAFASFGLHHDEHIFGLGEDFGPVDKRGIHRRLWLQEGFGNSSPASYKQTPFYMSTRGYGLFVNTSNAISFRVGELDHSALSVIVEDTHELDFYWMYGPTLNDILPRYTCITGAPTVPPKWSFGLWMGRITYNRQDQVEQVAQDLRDHHIPCDLIHIDTGWYENDWECDYVFGKEKFPDPAGMLQRLKEKGFRTSLWQWPNMAVGSEIFAEGQAKGYFAKRPNGQVYTFPGFLADAGFIDYSKPEAVTWVQGKIRALLEMGVAAIKVDFGEGAPPDAVYDSVPSESMHNLYPLIYGEAMYEISEEVHGQGDALLWARSAWAGSQRYPVHWSGDGVARFEDLACVLRSALSFGMSGFPFYSHDIGGFSGLPSLELYVRWAQLGLFSSHARCHGEPPREPWEYGDEAERIFRQYTELRYRLIPYIYSEAVECGRASLPLVRALVLDFQYDPTSAMITDQYMFGRSLLVAPILDHTNRRRIYIPPGTWVDYWTKEMNLGPQWIEVEASLDMLPIFVKGGAILPYAPLCQYVDEKPVDPLTLEIYAPQTKAKYAIFESQQSVIHVNYKMDNDVLSVETDPAPGQIEIVIYQLPVRAAHRENKSLDIEKTENDGYKVEFDGRPPSRIEFMIEL